MSHPWFQSQVPTEDTRGAGKCCPQRTSSREVWRHLGTGGWPGPPLLSGGRGEPGRCPLSCEAGVRGVYLLAVLFLPAALAPSAYKRNPDTCISQGGRQMPPTATRQAAAQHQLSDAGGSWPPPPAPLLRLEKSAPSGERESAHLQPKFAWPFKSGGAPIANTNPATAEPWGLSEK